MRQANRPADLEVSFSAPPFQHFRHASRVDDRLELAIVLRDPEANIGATGKQSRVRIPGVKLGQRRDISRRKKAATLVFGREIILARNRLECIKMLARSPIVGHR